MDEPWFSRIPSRIIFAWLWLRYGDTDPALGIWGSNVSHTQIPSLGMTVCAFVAAKAGLGKHTWGIGGSPNIHNIFKVHSPSLALACS
jgi:hypothetical protein